MVDFQAVEFDVALETLRSPYAAEELHEHRQRVLFVRLPENLSNVTSKKASEFFDRAKLLNMVTVAGVLDPQPEISHEVLSAFDLVFTTSDTACEAVVKVFDIDEAVAEIVQAVERNPHSTIMLAQLLRQRAFMDVSTGLVSESLVYASLQSGPEFQTWLSERSDSSAKNNTAPAVLSERHGMRLELSLNRPNRANAFSIAMRDELVEQLRLANSDASIEQIILKGEGKSFCSGGDLSEFGLFDNAPEAHFTRMARSPAFWMHKLKDQTTVYLRGNCIGAGIELPAFSKEVIADETLTISLPEIKMGLIPGSGGTVSIPRRIGPQKTAYLAISGKSIDLETAISWKLVDKIEPTP